MPHFHKVGVAHKFPCILSLPSPAGGRKIGVAYTAVTVEYSKHGQDFLTSKSLAAEDWIELGCGIYLIVFNSIELNTLGGFIYNVSGAGVLDYSGMIDLIPEELDTIYKFIDHIRRHV